jgi:hypothetical protein
VGVPLLVCLRVGLAMSDLPARSLLAREMLHERWAAASGPTSPPSAIGMMWSACQGSLGLGPSPQMWQVVAVALMSAACVR